jgi:replicative DNA helicase
MSEFDELPPHSTEAEQGVLGCILEAPGECLDDCRSKLAGAEAFYEVRHQQLYHELVAMAEEGAGIDMVTLVSRLKDRGTLETAGGVSYLSSLPEMGLVGMVGEYLEIVRDKWQRRQMLRLCSESRERTHTAHDFSEVIAEASNGLMRISEDRSGKNEVGMRELMSQTIEVLENYHRGHGQLSGYSTGFEYLNKLTCGFEVGNMFVIAARPSVGKTAFMLQLADQMATINGAGVAIFSLEMTVSQLGIRLACGRAGADSHRLRTGFFEHKDFGPLTTAIAELGKLPIVIDDTAGLSIVELRARARRLHRTHGIKIVMVDYLQLLHGDQKGSREQEVSDISQQLKAMAKELSVVVIVLAQLNRAIEKEKNRAPILSDLRESGSIEQDADLVGFLWQPKIKDMEVSEDWSKKHAYTTLTVAKQRNGPTGPDRLLFKKWSGRFEEVAAYDGEGADDERDERGSEERETGRGLPTNAELGL